MNKKPYILIVDDDKEVVRYLKKALVEDGYDVATTTSGKRAQDIIEAQTPDLLILDLNMADLDGFELLKLERSRFPYLRILVISGYLHGDLLDAAKIFGANATLEKPVTSEALLAKVRELLGR